MQVLRLLVLSLSLTAVFFALGIILASLVVVEAGDVRRLYFRDLAGAALGCLLAVPLQATIGPPAMVFVSMVALGALGLIVALATRTGQAQAGVLAAVVLAGAFGTASLDVRADGVKTLKETDTVVAGDWGPVFRVDAVDLGNLQVLHHDGLWGSSIWRYDGTPATTARFDTDNRKVPFAALGRDPEHLLIIIGAAGGNEIQGALTYGVGQVDAVELNPVTVDLLRNHFAEYSGNIANNPKVNYVQGDGRTFLARSERAYDMVWFVAPDSYAASNAATSGAFVLSESYLYTDAMIREAFDHLTPGGVMVAQFGDFDFDTRPTRTARSLVTARDALADRIGTFADHVVLLADSGEVDLQRVSTIMVFKSPVTADAVAGVQAALQTLPTTRPMHLPGVAAEASQSANITEQLITGTDAEVQALVGSYRFDISTVTDDKPFFSHFTPYSDVLTNWERGIEDTEIAIGERLLLVLFIIGSIVAGLLRWLPFAITRRRGGEAAAAAPGRAALFTLLIATAVGARISHVIERFGRRGLPFTTVLLWAVNGFFSVLGSSLTTMLSMSFGFDRTVVIGLVRYIVATLAHLRRPVAQPAPAIA
jgi:hypothetical protein